MKFLQSFFSPQPPEDTSTLGGRSLWRQSLPLVGACVAAVFTSLPAWAGDLTYWRYDENNNRLTFYTNEGTQPQAQLVPNPTRLVIDLPNTRIANKVNNFPLEQRIKYLRIAQFNPTTTRVVIEIDRDFTVDPNQVKVRGVSATEWFVELPEPVPIESVLNQPAPTTPDDNSPGENSDTVTTTSQGLMINLGQAIERSQIEVARSDRRREKIEIELEDVLLPPELRDQTETVNRYGVEKIEFTQTSERRKRAKIILHVDEDSPNWRAIGNENGLILLPEGGTNISITPPSSPTQISTSGPGVANPAIVEGIELANNNTQLLIRTNNRVFPQGRWNSNENRYELTVANASLASNLIQPRLSTTGPISKIFLREAGNNVLIYVEPAAGVRLGELNLPGETLIALEIFGSTRTGSYSRPGGSSIFVPPATAQNYPSPNVPSRPTPQGQLVVVLDPGHGGKDPGTVGRNNTYEKNIILPISQEVARILEREGIKVIMTRNSDYFVTLQGRTDLANRAGADLFVSIHANAISLSRPEVNGLETYYYQSGERLARTIHNQILREVNIGDRGVRTARFYVLRQTAMPSVLVEVGFLTGRIDHPNLVNPAYRSQMAQAIANGILTYVRQTY